MHTQVVTTCYDVLLYALPIPVNATNTGTPEPAVCSDGFYRDEDGICRPECGVWEAFSYGTYIPVDAMVIITASVFFISAAVLLVLSCVHYKNV